MSRDMLHEAELMTGTMRKYMECVQGVFNHMDHVTQKGVEDVGRVELRSLNEKYGVPDGTLRLSRNMYPTIPTNYVGLCNKGSRYLYNLG